MDDLNLPNGKNAEPCILVIFGATGDLTARKLIPALYNLAKENQLPAQFACVGFARREKTDEIFRNEMFEAIKLFSRNQPIDADLWKTFSQNLFYHRSEFDNDAGYESLKTRLEALDKNLGTKGNRVYYLSTPPSYFPLISEKLNQHQLIYNDSVIKDKWSRVIIEKPFGHDLESAKTLQGHIQKYLSEKQIYRIDHYLGKETVQNLLVFRFSNSIFEDLWNQRHVDHVQITVAEDMGIGTRGHFWEEAGMLRDIVQNHMMQLISLVAMEPPRNLSASAIHNEKVKVLESIRLNLEDQLQNHIIRGQYGPGIVKNEPVKGYRQENDVSPTSNVETYVAMQFYIDSWRWAGVPFYLRAGKRMPKRSTEIAIIFKNAPGVLFQTPSKRNEANILVIRIQPNEGISLKMNCKVPGLTTTIQPVNMDFRYDVYFETKPPEAYERLICDCMMGDSTLFTRSDEVLASWKLITPILQKWQSHVQDDFPNYSAGSWGPSEADLLLAKEGRKWQVP